MRVLYCIRILSLDPEIYGIEGKDAQHPKEKPLSSDLPFLIWR